MVKFRATIVYEFEEEVDPAEWADPSPEAVARALAEECRGDDQLMHEIIGIGWEPPVSVNIEPVEKMSEAPLDHTS